MKRKQTSKPIDSYKLKNLCLDKGYLTALSEEMGYGGSSLSRTISSGRISNQMAMLLEKVYGIKYEDYKPEEKPATELVGTVTEESKADATQTPLNTATIESLLRTMSSQISHLNNNILALIEIEKQIAFVKGRK